MSKNSPVVLRRFGVPTPLDKRKLQKLSLKALTGRIKTSRDNPEEKENAVPYSAPHLESTVQRLLEEDTPPPLIKRLPSGLSSTARRRLCQPVTSLISSDEDSPIPKKPGCRWPEEDSSPLLPRRPLQPNNSQQQPNPSPRLLAAPPFSSANPKKTPPPSSRSSYKSSSRSAYRSPDNKTPPPFRSLYKSPVRPSSKAPPSRSPDNKTPPPLRSLYKSPVRPSSKAPPFRSPDNKTPPPLSSLYKSPVRPSNKAPPSRSPDNKTPPPLRSLYKSPVRPSNKAPPLYRTPDHHSSSDDEEAFEALLKNLKDTGKKKKKRGFSRSSDEDDNFVVVSDEESEEEDEASEEEKTFIHVAVPPSAFEEKISSDEDETWTPPPSKPKSRNPPQPAAPAKSSPPKVLSGSHKYKSFLASLNTTVDLASCLPEARPYRTHFSRNKEELTHKLFQLFNQRVFQNKLPSDFSITWNVRLRKTAGHCINTRFLGRYKSRVELSTKILDAPDRLRDTLIHELCHAATWMLSEKHDHHGPFWQAWAKRARHAFPELPPIARCHTYAINHKYIYQCTKCGGKIGRHSKSIDVERKVCGRCRGKLELRLANGKPVKNRRPPSASLQTNLDKAFERLKI